MPDHPRIRGEHHPSVFSFPPDGGSSPHTRGALAECGGFGVDGGIIPAYAGSTLIVGDEDPHAVGSSPHTRGAPAEWPEQV